MNEDKATRYNRLRRQAGVASVGWGVLLLLGLALSGGSLAVRDTAEGLASVLVGEAQQRAVSVVIYTVLLTLLYEVGGVPLGLYSEFVLERRYGLSRQSFGAWVKDQTKSLALGTVLGAAAGSILYFLISRFPLWWWLPAAAVLALFFVGLANVGPLLLLPLFYSIRPLSKASLRERLIALGERAGTRVLDAYEWGVGQKTNKANAALTGIGASRRILVSDTMLDQYSDDEIEVVLAHEIAHHVHGDIWKGLAFETGLIVAGFAAAAWLLRVVAPVAGLRGTDDIAGLPVLLLAAGAVSLLILPASHAMSRAHERRADHFALTLTRNPPAFVSAMKRLAVQNLAEESPSTLVRWLFYSHPPIGERIAAAQSFKI